MEKLLKFIVSSIVENPQAVEINKEVIENQPINLSSNGQVYRKTLLTLKVDPQDIKIVIGKQGRTIKSIRQLLRVLSIREKTSVDLQLQES